MFFLFSVSLGKISSRMFEKTANSHLVSDLGEIVWIFSSTEFDD
jgi:hypothetical protein